MRVEVYGCPYTSPVLAYSAPPGDQFSPAPASPETGSDTVKVGVISLTSFPLAASVARHFSQILHHCTDDVTLVLPHFHQTGDDVSDVVTLYDVGTDVYPPSPDTTYSPLHKLRPSDHDVTTVTELPTPSRHLDVVVVLYTEDWSRDFSRHSDVTRLRDWLAHREGGSHRCVSISFNFSSSGHRTAQDEDDSIRYNLCRSSQTLECGEAEHFVLPGEFAALCEHLSRLLTGSTESQTSKSQSMKFESIKPQSTKFQSMKFESIKSPSIKPQSTKSQSTKYQTTERLIGQRDKWRLVLSLANRLYLQYAEELTFDTEDTSGLLRS